MKPAIAAVMILLAGSMSRLPALSYVESSNGLQTPALEGGHTEMEFGDINNDGNVDILSIGDHGNPYVNTDEHGVMVWFGDGLGSWSVFQNGDFGYGGNAIGDVNNDGFLDIGYGMHHNYSGVDFGDSMVEAALGDGTGRNWTPWDNGLGPPSGTWGMFSTDFADINRDGWLDLASNTFGYGNGFRVYLNNHDGSWTQCYNGPTGNSNMDLVFGDINNDGKPDIAASNANGAVWFGDGLGGFTLAQHNMPLDPGGAGGITLGDIDNDGAQELAYCANEDSIRVWKWNAVGDSWLSLRNGLPASGYEAVQLRDMNSDGFVDLVGFGSSQGRVWTGDGTGQWTEAASFSTGTPGYYEAFRVGGDVDHNGYPDIVVVDDEGTWPSDHNVAHCFHEGSVPDSLRVRPVFPRGGERFMEGSVQFVDWTCAVPPGETALVRLDLFINEIEGEPNGFIAESLPNSGRFQWSVPFGGSDSCFIRYIATTRTHVDTVFTAHAFFILSPMAVTERPAPVHPGLRLQVIPNPTRGRAAVVYSTPERARVRVTLHDVAGREVKVLFAGDQAAGVYTVALPTGIGAGIYFAEVTCGLHRETRKFTVP